MTSYVPAITNVQRRKCHYFTYPPKQDESYDQEEENGDMAVDSAEEEPRSDLTNQSGNSNFVNEMLEQMEVSPDGEKKCPICSRVLKVRQITVTGVFPN